MTVSMNQQNQSQSKKLPSSQSTMQVIKQPSAFPTEPFVNAQQASAALNLPLYYFVNPYKRAKLGIPHYFINRLVRYRLRELHKWQVAMSTQLAAEAEKLAAISSNKASASPVVNGGVHA
jgi:hypothetical protein